MCCCSYYCCRGFVTMMMERHLGSRKNQFHSLPVRRDRDTDDREVLWVMRFKTPPEWFVRMSFCIGQKSTLLRSTTLDRIPVVSNFHWRGTIFRVKVCEAKKIYKKSLAFSIFQSTHTLSFFTTTSILYKSIVSYFIHSHLVYTAVR